MNSISKDAHHPIVVSVLITTYLKTPYDYWSLVKKKKKPEKIVKRWLDNGKLGWVLVVFAQEVRFLPESYMIAQWVTVMLQYWLDYITVIFGTKIKVGGNLCFHFFLTVTLYLAHFNNVALLILNILFFTFTLQQLLTVYLFIVFILLLHSLKKNTRWLI